MIDAQSLHKSYTTTDGVQPVLRGVSLQVGAGESLALTGESGSGRTTTIRALETRLRKQGWTIFEADATDLLAGQMYIGQLDERVPNVVKQLAERLGIEYTPKNDKEAAPPVGGTAEE